jgi:hypothetical protein
MVSPHTVNDPLAGPQAIEKLLAEKNPAGRFCHGEPDHRRYLPGDASDPTQLFDANLEPSKRVMRIYDACMAIPAFAEAHPRKQSDFDGH